MSRVLAKKIFTKKVLKWGALVILLLLAAFLRLYRIGEFMQFQGDEGRDALVLWRMAVEKRPTLIGPGTSVGNMYNGPLYYYLVLPSFIVAGLSPIGPSVFVALLSVATVWLIYQFGKEWFSPIAGSTAAVLYALSPTVIVYSRSSWNPNVMPFFAILVIFSAWKIYKGEGRWWFFILAVSLAVAVQAHYLGLLLIPTAILWWILSLIKVKSEQRLDFKHYSIYATIVFFLLMSPILLFDIRHQFINTKAMWVFFTQRQTTVNFKVYKAIPQFVPLFTQATTRLLAAGLDNLGKLTSFVVGVGAVILLVRQRRSGALWLLASWLFIGLVGLGLYKQSVYDHYFGFIFPAFFLLLGAVVEYFWRLRMLYRLAVIGGFLGLIWTSILQSPAWGYPNFLYQHTQVVAQKIIQEARGQPFNLGMIAKQNYDAGYRFVLTKSGAPLKETPQEITEQLFVVCETKVAECNPVGHPKAEIANFGWAKIDGVWYFTWGTTLFRLTHNRPT